MSQYQEEFTGLDLEDWMEAPWNVALINEKGDIAMFERQWSLANTVAGHYFFYSRGRAALDTARSMLKEIFTGPYQVETIIGLTPLEHKAALWMNRRLGFQPQGPIETDAGPCELVLLRKAEWENMDNE